ncbi:MAG: transketolase [Dehalococcoidia bacterium]|nr:transketolase [Dehalococcoidia bacterium]
MTASSVENIEAVAKRTRRHIITMLAAAGSGHPGGSLSAVEILSALYFRILRHDPAEPLWPDRDRFILSKGHAVPVLYAVLAECGYFPEEELMTLRKLGSRLQGHAFAYFPPGTEGLCTPIQSPPGIEMCAGSLGQGLSYSIGQALAARLDGRDYRVYCLMGDGELDEGQVWEAAMAAAHYALDNLVAIIDRNRIQNDGFVDDIMRTDPLPAKWQSFGWHVIEVDGHNVSQLIDAFEAARTVKGKPTVIIAHTIKGKGVSFMENTATWHGRAPTPEEAERALAELA